MNYITHSLIASYLHDFINSDINLLSLQKGFSDINHPSNGSEKNLLKQCSEKQTAK